MLGYLLVIEALTLVATWIDAKIRDGSWFLRWCYWHLAPLWAAWLALVHLLDVCAIACARRTVERWHSQQALAAEFSPI